LLERPQEVVTRVELRRAIWPENVSLDYDLGLKKAVNRAREALGDSAESPRFIETIPRKGYRFLAPVTLVNRANDTRRGFERGAAFPPLGGDTNIGGGEFRVASYVGTSAEREIALWRHLAIALAVALATIVAIAWLTYGRTARPFQARSPMTIRDSRHSVNDSGRRIDALRAEFPALQDSAAGLRALQVRRVSRLFPAKS
jgi:hypothetical protein